MMKTQIMLDLETLGNRSLSVIVAIGAVKFGGGKILAEFYERVDAQSCIDVGLRIDVSTVFWWLKQNDAARAEICKPGLKVKDALLRFTEFVADPDAEIWGNGASFDNVLLSDAYDRTRLPRPWKYFNDRCYRTIKALHPDIPMRRTGVHHNALHDAKSQAEHLMEILRPNL
jgi:hypothetical protein